MSTENAARSWMVRQPAGWSMPICLQPRAVRQCRILEARGRRPVALSRSGYRLRARRRYQLEFVLEERSGEPRCVSLVAGPLRRVDEREQREHDERRTTVRLDMEFARRPGLRLPRCWSSRQTVVARVEYGDGREHYDHTLPVLIAPRRLWIVIPLLVPAVLFGVVPWLSEMLLAQGVLPAEWSPWLQLLSRSDLWLGLVAAILVLWLGMAAGDWLSLRRQDRRLREAIRSEMRRYMEMSAPR